MFGSCYEARMIKSLSSNQIVFSFLVALANGCASASSTPLEARLDAGPDAVSTEGTVPVQPNAEVPFFGVDGEYSLDVPPEAFGDKKVCTADYVLGTGRNVGAVVLSKNEQISFFADREAKTVIAEGCTYAYLGFKGDPHYFGPKPEKYPSSVWLTYELKSGPGTCESYHFVTLRPPHGDGAIKHMHARWAPKSSSIDALLQMSIGDYKDGDECNPWWNVYCTKGSVGCDN
jgi:hypothetical protein